LTDNIPASGKCMKGWMLLIKYVRAIKLKK
jgi:hypothetical protein